MAILRMKEIRGMTTAERQKKLEELSAELTRTNALRTGAGNVENPGRIKQIRKTIARILTAQAEKQSKKL